jgi:hypothetical protein
MIKDKVKNWWLDQSYQSPAKLCWDRQSESVFGSSKSCSFNIHHVGLFVRVSHREKEMHQWIEFVVMMSLSVSFVDCVHTRSISRLKPISGRSLRRHILSLRDILKETIQKELPSRYAVVFDGWTEGTHHYIGIAALFI